MTKRTNKRFRTTVKARLHDAYRGTTHTIITPIVRVLVVRRPTPKQFTRPRQPGRPGNTPFTLRLPPPSTEEP